MNSNIISAIESIMFFWSDPIELSDLEKLLDISKKETIKSLEIMQGLYINDNRGLRLKKIGSSYQLVTAKENHKYIEKLLIEKDEKKLSNSMMETLSIIAYKQPVTRIEIDEIRGIKSTSPIQTLLQRGIIKEVGKLDKPGKPILYGTTDEFLRIYGLDDISKLPNINDFDMSREENNETE